MHDFSHQRPTTLAAAVDALRGARDGRALAGGMTLLPILKQRLARPSTLVDLSGIEDLVGINRREQGLYIGAMTTHDAVARSPLVRSTIPALATLAAGIGDPQVRNRGTLGGALASNDPAGDYPAAALGLGATLYTDRRTIASDDFFLGFFETALADDEVIVGVSFPIPRRAGYVKFEQAASRYALAGVFVAETTEGARVAVCGASPCVFRASMMERALTGSFSVRALAGIAMPAEDLIGDVHATAAYRAHLITVMARRAVLAAG